MQASKRKISRPVPPRLRASDTCLPIRKSRCQSSVIAAKSDADAGCGFRQPETIVDRNLHFNSAHCRSGVLGILNILPLVSRRGRRCDMRSTGAFDPSIVRRSHPYVDRTAPDSTTGPRFPPRRWPTRRPHEAGRPAQGCDPIIGRTVPRPRPRPLMPMSGDRLTRGLLDLEPSCAFEVGTRVGRRSGAIR